MTRRTVISYRNLLVGALTCVLVSAARLTQAADPLEVETLIARGVELRQQGHDQAALPFFQRAYETGRSPRTSAQLGLVELSLGYALSAEKHLKEALASPRHQWVMKYRDKLEASLREASATIGELAVGGTPAGADITVNGTAVGKLPLPEAVRVEEGSIQVIARAAGFTDVTKTVKVAGGAREVLTIELAPAVAGSNDSAGAEGGSRPTRPTPHREKGVRPQDTLQARRSTQSTAPGWVLPAAWTTSGLAVAALGVGGYFLWTFEKNQDAFNKRLLPGTSQHACGTMSPNHGDDRCNQLLNDSESAQRLMYVGFQAAGLLAAVSLVGFLWSSPADATSHAVHSEPHAVATVSGDGVWVGYHSRF